MAKRASGTSNSHGDDRGAAGELQRAGEWAAGVSDNHIITCFATDADGDTVGVAGDHITYGISYTIGDCEHDATRFYGNTISVTVSNGGPANRDSGAAIHT